MSSDSTLWRGGRKLELTKVPDSFTARMRPGVQPEELAQEHDVVHQSRAERQNLEVFGVSPEVRDTAMDEIRSSPEVEFASHIYQVKDDPSSRVYLTDEIMVQFRIEVSDDEIEEITEKVGLTLVKEASGLPRAYTFRVTSRAGENPIKIANRLLEDPRVLAAEPNLAYSVQHFYTPGDSLYPAQWHLDHNGGPWLTPGSHINAARAWDITRGDRKVVVAVIDDSCDLSHPDLQGEGKIVAPRDFAGRDFDPMPEQPGHRHGTACAAVAVAESNGHGVVGVAPGCALMPIRMSGILDDNSIVELFDWAYEHGAAVISCSWGLQIPHGLPLHSVVDEVLRKVATKGRNGLGCVIFFAAGNANRPIDGQVDEHGWPGNVPGGPTPWFNGFAAHPDVIAVAACTSQGRKAAYSSWGREISICAPSNNTHPQLSKDKLTYPLIDRKFTFPGLGVVTADRVGWEGYSLDDYTRDFGGTSSACPTAAGVAALVLSANPNLTAREVRQILETTADKIEDPDPDPQLGNTFGTYDKGHSLWFGHGKVNAFRAVTEAVKRKGDGRPITTMRQVSAPSLDIPDNDETGVCDTIHFAEEASLADIAIQVDIDHPTISDLRLTLTAPSGDTVVLHNRNGGNTQSLKASFDTSTTPGLSNLIGKPLSGSWKLNVQDLATGHTGCWNSWSITAAAQTDARPDTTTLNLVDIPGVLIPDNRPEGISRYLQVAPVGRIRDLEVSVDITHSYIGDLSVVLVSPTGTQVELHQRTGGNADNLITTYTPATTSGLQRLRGETVHGTWTLTVKDLEAQDEGKLNRWALHLTYAPVTAGSQEAVNFSAWTGARDGTGDDLTLIKNIDPATATRLRQAGIQTFSQLATMTPTTIAEHSGVSLSQIRREKWASQAKTLAAQMATEQRAVGDTLSLPTMQGGDAPAIEPLSQHYETFTVRLTLDANGKPQRTLVVHVQGGADQTWPRWDGNSLIDFIEQAALKPGSAESAPAAAGAPVLSQGGDAELERLEEVSEYYGEISQSPNLMPDSAPDLGGDSGQPGVAVEEVREVEAGTIQIGLRLEITDLNLAQAPGKPRLRAGVTFQLSGSTDDLQGLHNTPYLLQIFASEIETGRQITLTSTHQQFLMLDTTEQQPFSFKISAESILIDFDLPDPGRYELQTMLSFIAAELFVLKQGPVFSVTE